jgi:Domain of unknown function (DUF4304)
MDIALKSSVVSVLRESGFTGSYPHLRRLHVTHVDLLTFQFDVNGGGFLIEITRCGIGGTTSYGGKHIPASNVTVWDIHPDDRLRIKRGEGSGTDSWFRYESGRYDEVASQVLAKLPIAHEYWSQRGVVSSGAAG